MLNVSKMVFYSAFLLLSLFPLWGFAKSDHDKKERMIGDLNFIKNTFRVGYAPADWKKLSTGWDLNAEIQNAVIKILSLKEISCKDYHRIVKEFFNSAKDYHVSVFFYSTESASLPFRVKGANGSYFFSYVDRNRLSQNIFPFAEGDELVAFDGRPTDEVIQELKNREIQSYNEATNRGIAEIYLTDRKGMFGHVVPNGPVTITVRNIGSSKLSSYQLIWNYKPEKVTHTFAVASPENLKADSQLLAAHPIFRKVMAAPFYKKTFDYNNQDEDEEDHPDMVGARKSFIPTLGRIWWESDDSCPFHAYLYETKDRELIGYVRIPSYMGGQEQVEEFAKIIDFFEERSAALVVDQINNPGGMVFYLYALASMLTDQPLKTPKHRMKLTPEEVFFAAIYIPIFESIQSDVDAQTILGENFLGIPVTYQMAQFFLNYFRFIVDEWNAGHTITQPFYLYGIDHINPHPVTRYTKPILLLVNHMDFSGGDFFPAIFQDNKRAIILGSKTAGAGGYVVATSFPNLYGVALFSYTASIAERTDANPIENLGVTPDISYEICEEDLQYGYQKYTHNIQNAVYHLLQK
jgi:PDZ domain/Peptidase family S41